MVLLRGPDLVTLTLHKRLKAIDGRDAVPDKEWHQAPMTARGGDDVPLDAGRGVLGASMTVTTNADSGPSFPR
jgi:hypothetical protein